MKKILLKKIVVMGLMILMMFATACGSNGTNNIEENSQPHSEIETQENETSNTQYPIEIQTKFGEKVIIEEEPETILSFSPEMTEIIFELGAGDKLIGRSTYCNYPEEVLEIEEFGTLLDLNVETIIEANADLVVLSSMIDQDLFATLMNQGVNVLALDYDENFEGTMDYIEVMGSVLNRNEEATNVIKDIRNILATLDKQLDGVEKPTAYFVIGAGEWDSTATGDTFIGDMMEKAGAINVASDGTNWSYNIELLIEQDPDILITSEMYREALSDLEGYKDLTAIQEGRLFVVEEDKYYRQGPRIKEALLELAEIFHPNITVQLD
ncbi:iron complex transport system substrate-binding protein [Natranaerovirga hydrolytica]|uniref:Iron complex transport system substrate-binding protein n=1 Tax=Natranaerovirga hydrolytica TaxID=680378 RepID=A0A4R1M6V0_9FIRM|nr:ABC transporter substrate-binding protein [Natranaerovirga hydrolytica]TCK88006.1 iron complex transport system substrate-binding protein [Natranaerovirga hydrolytica]